VVTFGDTLQTVIQIVVQKMILMGMMAVTLLWIVLMG